MDSTTTCHSDANEIRSIDDTDVESCISRCDVTPECGFSFFGEDNSCSLFHTCDMESLESTSVGTTYQKLGNGISFFFIIKLDRTIISEFTVSNSNSQYDMISQ